MGDKTKIDWADATWNPVTGCRHGCEYCYARKIAERFGGCDKGSTYGMYCQATWRRVNPESSREEAIFEIDAKCPPIKLHFDPKTQIMHTPKAPYPWGFSPTLHREKMDVPQKWKKPRTIFVCSMADLFGDWVPDEWIKEVFDACRKAPQHRYLFLTKNPQRYIDLGNQGVLPRWNEAHNMWFGSTAAKKQDKVFGDSLAYNTFLSIEPILEPFDNLGDRACIVDWIIVGAETGNRKGKITPEKGWIMEIAEGCRRTNTPIFMKESLREIMGADFIQEFPWDNGKEV